MSLYAWYLNPENGDTKVFATAEAEIIAKAGYRLVGLDDLPLLSLHAVGMLVKTPPELLAQLRDGLISLDQLDYDEEGDCMYLAGREPKPLSQPLMAVRQKLAGYSELGRLL